MLGEIIFSPFYMSANPNKQFKKVLVYLSKKEKGIPEQDLIKKFDLDSDWYAKTFRGGNLVNSKYDDKNDIHIITLSATGFSHISGLKHWYEKPAGLIFIGIIIGVATTIIGFALQKNWDIFKNLF